MFTSGHPRGHPDDLQPGGLFEARRRKVGFMDKTIKAAYPELPPMVGFAVTVTCRTAFDANAA